MTVSASSSSEFQVDDLSRMAFLATGLLEAGKQPPAEDLAIARDFMNLELQALQAEGVILRTVERASLTLGTPDLGTVSTYTLPSDTIDVRIDPNDQVGTIVDSTGNESLVVNMTRAEYMDLANKTASVTARPGRAYVEKLAAVTVTLWPAPDATSLTLKYARVRLLRDADTGGVTIDLARRWMKFIVYATAVHLGRAKSIQQSDLAELRAESERMKAVCLADDAPRGKVRFRLAHSGRRW